MNLLALSVSIVIIALFFCVGVHIFHPAPRRTSQVYYYYEPRRRRTDRRMGTWLEAVSHYEMALTGPEPARVFINAPSASHEANDPQRLNVTQQARLRVPPIADAIPKTLVQT
jgi:hypothetical protein